MIDSGPTDNLSNSIRAAFAEASISGFGVVHHERFFDADLFEIGVKVLGNPTRGRDSVSGIDILTPTQTETAPLRSLSKIHGVGAFPFHTDGAHWNKPPQWLVLACKKNTEQRATTLLQAQTVLAAFGEEFSPNEALFLVANGRNSWLFAIPCGSWYERVTLNPARRFYFHHES